MKKALIILTVLALAVSLCACAPEVPAAPVQTQAIAQEPAPAEPAAAPVAQPEEQTPAAPAEEPAVQAPVEEPAVQAPTEAAAPAPAPAPAPKSDSASSAVNVIGEEKAKAIALAKVPGATEADLRIHLESDDGRAEYEGEIIYGGTEYDFEIDAVSGQVLEWDSEPWPDRD